MNIDELSGAELDALAATSVMGWHRQGAEEGGDAWYDAEGHLQVHTMDFGPSEIDCFSDTETVLLKALGDGMQVELEQLASGETPFIATVSRPVGIRAWEFGEYSFGTTLPLALVRAICKAYEAEGR
jgi:hypothetical protein